MVDGSNKRNDLFLLMDRVAWSTGNDEAVATEYVPIENGCDDDAADGWVEKRLKQLM